MRKFFVLLLFAIFLLNFSVFPQTQENITIATYYPSPHGVYNELRVKRMLIGDNYYSSAYCWPPDTCAHQIPATADPNDPTNSAGASGKIDLVVEGAVGIGKSNPTYPLDINVVPGTKAYQLTWGPSGGWKKGIRLNSLSTLAWGPATIEPDVAKYCYMGYHSSAPKGKFVFGFVDSDDGVTSGEIGQYAFTIQGNKNPQPETFRDEATGNVITVVPESYKSALFTSNVIALGKIGVRTRTPDYSLQVNGTVVSSNGGDICTDKAGGTCLAQLDLPCVTKQCESALSSCQVVCDPGYRATGGGIDVANDANVKNFRSGPYQGTNSNAWTCLWDNDGKTHRCVVQCCKMKRLDAFPLPQ